MGIFARRAAATGAQRQAVRFALRIDRVFAQASYFETSFIWWLVLASWLWIATEDASARCPGVEISAGQCDSFSPPTEPTSPRPELAAYVDGRTSLPLLSFDEIRLDRWFAHTLRGIPQNVCSAELRLSLEADSSCFHPIGNDSISLELGTEGLEKEIRISDLVPGRWRSQSSAVPRIDIGSLPGGDNLLYALSDGALDVVVQDDTGVDCISLCLQTCQCSTPNFTPTFWNVGSVQRNNNCYNYALNHRTNSYAQPGRISGERFGFSCPSLEQAAISDGLRPAPASLDCPDDETLVALVLNDQDLGFAHPDYHWYRQDSDGLWSHKIGRSPATRLDESGNLIQDPETADRGIYYIFCGYYCACSSAQEGEGHEQIH